MDISKGTKGNATGNLLEQTVQSVLMQKGFKLISHKEWERLGDRLRGNYLIINAPFTTVYGHRGKTEFIIKSDRLPELIRLECKWQQSAGSVDEKLPYLYLNCIEAMPESHIIILIDGKGWKPGSLQWLKTAVSEKKYQPTDSPSKNIDVMNLSEFLTWANNVFV